MSAPWFTKAKTILPSRVLAILKDERRRVTPKRSGETTSRDGRASIGVLESPQLSVDGNKPGRFKSRLERGAEPLGVAATETTPIFHPKARHHLILLSLIHIHLFHPGFSAFVTSHDIQGTNSPHVAALERPPERAHLSLSANSRSHHRTIAKSPSVQNTHKPYFFPSHDTIAHVVLPLRQIVGLPLTLLRIPRRPIPVATQSHAIEPA
ncbi:hypothetical protein CC78DRAFT_585519 [Lojkania enalia]|uniref:Uncharacterized protein n=1 Tax=Lojkania enalia TaxID=147567 RepID=A0A9P4K471_9PLEO|nr:hypothetical protein CC78DRAFT_585519 [Didymosphaeria enalia]